MAAAPARCLLAGKMLTSQTASSALEMFHSVEEVDMSDNRIEALLTPLPSRLVTLNLSRNAIRSLAALAGLESLQALRELNLSGNELDSCEGLADNVSLRRLDLSANRVAVVAGLERLRDLQELNLADNRLASCDDVRSLSINGSLGRLRLSGNPITEIPRYKTTVLHLLPSVVFLDDFRQSRSPRVGRSGAGQSYAAMHSLRTGAGAPGSPSAAAPAPERDSRGRPSLGSPDAPLPGERRGAPARRAAGGGYARRASGSASASAASLRAPSEAGSTASASSPSRFTPGLLRGSPQRAAAAAAAAPLPPPPARVPLAPAPGAARGMTGFQRTPRVPASVGPRSVDGDNVSVASSQASEVNARLVEVLEGMVQSKRMSLSQLQAALGPR